MHPISKNRIPTMKSLPILTYFLLLTSFFAESQTKNNAAGLAVSVNRRYLTEDGRPFSGWGIPVGCCLAS